MAADCCYWCDQPGDLLCDGVLAEPVLGPGRTLVRPGVTCDVPLCRAHALRVGTMFLDYRTGPKGGRRAGHCETIDWCPDCVARDELRKGA